MTKDVKAIELPEKPVRMSQKEFILKAITFLNREASVKLGREVRACPVVNSGFNEAFRAYFPGVDVVKATGKLIEEGVLGGRTMKGGFLLWRMADQLSPDEYKAQKIAEKAAAKVVRGASLADRIAGTIPEGE